MNRVGVAINHISHIHRKFSLHIHRNMENVTPFSQFRCTILLHSMFVPRILFLLNIILCQDIFKRIFNLFHVFLCILATAAISPYFWS